MSHPPPPTQIPSDAFVCALTQSQTALRGYCEAALGRGEDAKDAWQRTNLRLWLKSGDWQEGTTFVSWAIAVARFEVLGVIRDRKRERIIFDTDVAELMADAATEHATNSTNRRDALAHCLEKLLPRQRNVLAAHYVSGFPIAEIATSQGMGSSAVKVLLLRVRRSLAACIQKHQIKESAL